MFQNATKCAGGKAVRRLLAALLVLVTLVCLMPLSASAAVAPPTSMDAPPHFGATFNYSNFTLYINASDSVRDYMARRIQDDPENSDLKSFVLYYQVDAKINNGSWQYTSEWDSPKTVPDNHKNRYYIPCQDGEYYAGSGSAYFHHLFSDETITKTIQDAGWDYFKSNSITLRARFAQSFDNGNTYVLSPWSKEFVLSANVKVDAEKMINHAPTLKGAEIEMRGNTPYLAVKLEKPPRDIGDLNVATGGSVGAQIWLRKQGDKDFKQVHYWWVSNESILFDARTYFEDYKDHYEEAAYEIKSRYHLDLKTYRQSGYYNSTSTVYIYSPFSNVISHNMPAWSGASSWATGELKKANEAGLIPDILKGADLTKPITREEFAELAVLLYEKTMGQTAAATSPNPFKDTTNPQILKAFKLGITTGTTATTFAPKELINREQVATMLSRALRVIAPNADFSTTGAPVFADRKDISTYAVGHVLFMAKLEIIKGVDGKFMPKATTTAQKASGYATATREQSIAMSVRSYEKMDAIKSSKGAAVPVTQPASATPPAAQQPTTPAAPTESKAAASSANAPVIGTWSLGNISGGRYNAVSGKYEGGATGLGQTYIFKADGTFQELIIWSNAEYTTGKYSVKDGVITLTDRFAEESGDDGKTWGKKEALPDASAYFTAGTDEEGKYLLLGLEGAKPPLNPPANALKYRFKE
jgi:hypothetical protein